MNWGDEGLPERFWCRVVPEPNSGCWLWIGGAKSGEYGRTSIGGRRALAHRATFAAAFGNIEPGLELDHLCRVRACCNPYHLEPVTHLENMRRGLRAKKTHCPHGHEYIADNIYYTGIRGTSRACKTCVIARAAERRRTTRCQAVGFHRAGCHEQRAA